MEREIKFRAYINKSKEIKEISQINYATKTIVTTDGYCYGFKDIILMQYTGLKDKNGKEIYERDIVKSYYYIPNQDGTEGERYTIKVINYNGTLCKYNIDMFENLEVIGNIYDNKNLLERGE